MTREEINRELTQVTRELRSLDDEKQKYLNMNNKINEAIGKLTEAAKNARDAYTKMKTHYQSLVIAKEEKDLNNLSGNIQTQIDLLKQALLTSNSKIQRLDYDITAKTAKKRELNDKLRNLI